MKSKIDVGPLLKKTALCDRPRARRRMVAGLAKRGICPQVLQAMALVPRHAFVPGHLSAHAYMDRIICTGETNLTNPHCVALMTQCLQLNNKKRVLEIGTGSGYHTAILALLSDHVFSVERIASLVSKSAESLALLGLRNVSQKLADGYRGWPSAAPFDAILVAAAAPALPRALVSQLHPRHGRMVVPIGPQRGCQRLYLVRRTDRGILETDLGFTHFVPFVAGPPGLRCAAMKRRPGKRCGSPRRCAA